MDTRFGFRGVIKPVEPFRNHKETFAFGPYQISFEEGLFEIGYDDSTLAIEAQSVAARHISALGFSKNLKFSLELNQSWEKHTDGTTLLKIFLYDEIHMTDDLRLTSSALTDGESRIIATYDSRNLSNESELVQKSFSDAALGKAMQYFSEEVVGDDRPLYGIYKALEALAQALGGREQLAKLVGQPTEYVSAVMQTAQTTRHHNDPNAKLVLTEQECRDRARGLILSYANSIKLPSSI